MVFSWIRLSDNIAYKTWYYSDPVQSNNVTNYRTAERCSTCQYKYPCDFLILKSIMMLFRARTIHRRQGVLDWSPLSPSHLQRPGFWGFFFEPRVFYSVAVEGPQAGRGGLLLLWAHPHVVQGHMPGEILPQGGQEKVTLSLRSEELVGWRSLLLQR